MFCLNFLSLALVGVRQGRLEMENCVFQCETTGVIVRTSAQLTMNMCDLYGAKVSLHAATLLSFKCPPPRHVRLPET